MTSLTLGSATGLRSFKHVHLWKTVMSPVLWRVNYRNPELIPNHSSLLSICPTNSSRSHRHAVAVTLGVIISIMLKSCMTNWKHGNHLREKMKMGGRRWKLVSALWQTSMVYAVLSASSGDKCHQLVQGPFLLHINTPHLETLLWFLLSVTKWNIYHKNND